MAKKKKKPTPQTAAEKSARAAMYRAQAIGLDQQTARGSQVSKGAVKGRSLRSGGTDLMRYDLGRFTDDPFPETRTGGTPPTSTGSTTRTTNAKPSAPRSGKPGKASKPRRDVRKKGEGGNQRYSPRSPGTQGSKVVNTAAEKARRAAILAEEKRKRDQAIARRKEAARRRKAATQNQSRTTTGGRIMS